MKKSAVLTIALLFFLGILIVCHQTSSPKIIDIIDEDAGFPIIMKKENNKLVVDKEEMKKEYMKKIKQSYNIASGFNHLCCIDQDFKPTDHDLFPGEEYGKCDTRQGFSDSTWTEMTEDKKKHCLSYY